MSILWDRDEASAVNVKVVAKAQQLRCGGLLPAPPTGPGSNGRELARVLKSPHSHSHAQARLVAKLHTLILL